MILQIQLEGVIRTYEVTEDEINLNDWNDIIEDMLDTVEQAQDTKFLEVWN